MDTTTPPNISEPAPTASTDKTVAIVSYLTLIGFIVALILHSTRKNALGAFHLRQSLGLMLTSIVLVPVAMVLAFIPFLGWAMGMVLWIGILVFWVLGLVGAVNGQMKPLPVVGEYYQKWFASAFD